jgi:hypothetical protein
MSKVVTDTQIGNHIKNDARRAFLQQALGAVCVTASASILTGCSLDVADEFSKAPTKSNSDTKLFSEPQMTALFAIVDTILPRTDTPSASDVNCHGFVQNQLMRCHSAEQQASAVDIINQINQVSTANHKKPFPLLDNQQQIALLHDIEAKRGFSDKDAQHFSFLKALVVFGYFTSEAGATQALAYQAVPGGFKGSIPANAETKSWGSLDYY